MAGDFDAGEDSAGDAVAAPVASPVITRPRALRFDPATRAHRINADGTYADLHPVDALVANAIFITAGRLNSVPGLGTDWKKIESPHHPRAKRTAEDMIKLALAEPLKRKDITIMSIEFETRGAYTTMLVVNYVNNHLHPRIEIPVSVRI